MKKVIILIPFLVLLSTASFAQFNENYRPPEDPMKKHLIRKVSQYSKLKRTGFGLLGGGALITTVGIGLIASADWQDDGYGGIYTDDPEGPWGIIAIMYAGIPLIATGTTLSIIGSVKEKTYLDKLDNLNAYYINHNGAHGIRLVYNF